MRGSPLFRTIKEFDLMLFEGRELLSLYLPLPPSLFFSVQVCLPAILTFVRIIRISIVIIFCIVVFHMFLL